MKALNYIRRISLIAGSLFLGLSMAIAEGEGVARKTELSFFASSAFATQAELKRTIAFPEGYSFALSCAVTPITAEAAASATWEPAPFLNFSAGASAGSGWNIPFVPIAKGLCLNERTGAHGQEFSDETLSGVVWSSYGTATLQFDYAAIVPGEWNHVIFMLSNSMRYKAYTGADSGEAWLFKADAGTNMNGWTYSGNFFAGYQLPFHSTLIGGFAQVDQTLYDGEVGYGFGGENLKYCSFGPMVSAKLTNAVFLTVQGNLKYAPVHTDETKDYEYFEDWRIDEDNPGTVKFSYLSITVMKRF